MLGGRANAQRQRIQDLLPPADVSCSVHLFSTSILPHLSVPEHFDLLCRTDREVALRAAARYIGLLLHHLVNVYECAFSLILLLQKGHRCSAGYLRNQ